MSKKSVVVVGGGTGTYTILRGLKHYQDQLELTAIVTMADSGGSTGRLRDEFGMLPVGDVRMALSALADDNGANELLLRELFLYRFTNGSGLKGHNLGNLLLTALSDILGSEAEAIAAASRILRVAGTVLPSTLDNVHLIAKYDDGVVAEGEHLIDDPGPDRAGRRIIDLRLNPIATINPDADEVLRQADLIVIGPGDLYSSLLANCVVKGVPKAIRESKANLVYVANLMERFGQTEGMTLKDCLAELERYIGKSPDFILVNNKPLPKKAVEWYENKEGTKPVVDDLEDHQNRVRRQDILSDELFRQLSADLVNRSLIRHDPNKLAAVVMQLLN